ncbi:hypothetical protein [Streptomyces prunicolor]|uniref:hypothetical protein n=1 Tax=Streptomyces prunicolor TaxID=67348 RepID=UPI0033E6C49D
MTSAITATDLNRWQYRALEVLTRFAKEGLSAQRHPLNWQITSNGALRGEVDRYTPRLTTNDRRAIFDEWCRVVGAGTPRESKTYAGDTELRSVFQWPTNRGNVEGSLVLVIDAPLDGEFDEEGATP